MSGLHSVGYFLVSTLFGLAIFIVWLRIGLQYFRISTLHPIGQAVHRLTDPVILPLSKLLHIRLTRHQRYDWVSLGIVIALVFMKYLFVSMLYLGPNELNGWLIAVCTVVDLIVQPCNILFYALLIRVIMSWVNPQWQHPLTTALFMITEPMLKWARRMIPPIAGLDFSPLVIMILLKVITLFVTASLPFPLV